MNDFKIKLIYPGGTLSENTFTYKLQGKATIFDLKEAFTKEEGYTPEQLRIIYRKADMDVPLDDTDVLEDIEDQSGQFLIECPSVGVEILSGQFSIKHDEEVALLVGSKKKFEHFLLKPSQKQTLKLPMGKFLLFDENLTSTKKKFYFKPNYLFRGPKTWFPLSKKRIDMTTLPFNMSFKTNGNCS